MDSRPFDVHCVPAVIIEDVDNPLLSSLWPLVYCLTASIDN